MTIRCDSDCGEDGCPCAQAYAIRWIVAGLIFCTAIAVFVWTAPVLMGLAR